MEMLDKTADDDLARKAKIHQMMGKAHLLQAKIIRSNGKTYLANMEINKVEKHLRMAFTIFKDIAPLENAHLVSILSDLSDFYETNGESLMARKLLRKQLYLADKYLPPDHPKQSEYLYSFIRLHELHGLEDLAMKVAWKKVRNDQETFGKMHPIVAQTLMSMGVYDKVCRMLFKIKPMDEYGITQCLIGLARQTHLSKSSIELFQKWLNYLKKNYPTTERRIADVYCQFANIYNDMGQFDKAFTYLHQSLSIYRHHQDHLKLRTVEDFMRHIEQGAGRLHIANIVCDDKWENGIIFYRKATDRQILSSRPVKQKLRRIK
jgi:tetratricopeptide (TPR) repeat protein